jgi:hypothetical protein
MTRWYFYTTLSLLAVYPGIKYCIKPMSLFSTNDTVVSTIVKKLHKYKHLPSNQTPNDELIDR